uniref:Uncharacterized protein n=1 Tax=Rangifer tarandus platyrhynchus TaxID=3082113 RepID=A0ACB0F1H4_RANTA|nr:unnamed protein product [Rangifer tarandus platyrhynchus]
MDRPARLCPQLLPGLDLAEEPDTVSQPTGLVARTWRERPRPQASGPVARAPQKTQPGPPSRLEPEPARPTVSLTPTLRSLPLESLQLEPQQGIILRANSENAQAE